MSNSDAVKETTWGELPCGVPGYGATAGSYAGMIRQYAVEGEFVLALLYLEKAREANVIGRIENAAQEMFNAGSPAAEE